MEIVVYSDEIFVITRVEIFDETGESVTIFFELIELPNIKLGLFDTYSDAENAMKIKLSARDDMQQQD